MLERDFQMKFLFVIQNMKVGGVQNSLLNLTSELINQNYSIESDDMLNY